jgi:hypothetical protein
MVERSSLNRPSPSSCGAVETRHQAGTTLRAQHFPTGAEGDERPFGKLASQRNTCEPDERGASNYGAAKPNAVRAPAHQAKNATRT